MPLFGKRKESGGENKIKLENKLYLAREDPEPVFDVSDCDLKNVPPGIFSLCKVFRKESLCLQNNRLLSLSGGGNMQDLSLLQVLDLHCNCLTTLPNEIRFLKILKVLNVSYNKLTVLPGAVGALVKLVTLDASHNNLKELTPAIGDLRSLQDLDIKGNKLVTALPPALCHATSLKNIRLDPETFQYPPKEIVSLGTLATMQYLAQDDEFDYQAAVEASSTSSMQSSNASSDLDDKLQAKILELERLKDGRTRELLALAAEKEDQQRREFELYSSKNENKKELCFELSSASARLEEQLRAAAATNHTDRLRLVAEVVQAEAASDRAVSLILDAARDTDHNMALVLALERNQEQEMLHAAATMRDSTLRREEILRDMQVAVNAQAALVTEMWSEKASTMQALIQQDKEEPWLGGALSLRHERQAALAESLIQDEAAQKTAVAALLERADARSWALVQQVQAVEMQLVSLTNAEVRRKQLDLEQQGSRWEENRMQLSALLMDLLAAQAARRQHFLNTVRTMENQRQAGNNDFWLEQYQRLVDSMPASQREAERGLDRRLAARLAEAGAFHVLPLLAQALRNCTDLEQLDEKALMEAGLRNATDRQSVLDAIRDHLLDVTRVPTEAEGAHSAPSAPSPLLTEWDSRPECVVCMEFQCDILLAPCGHVCVCTKCAAAIALCPLCRSEITHKVRAIFP